MVDKIGRRQFNASKGGSIGRKSLGKKKFLTERERQEKTHEDAKEWRDKARESILHTRQKLEGMLKRNEAETEKKLEHRRKNINPLFFSLMTKFSRRGRHTLTHSTVPRKPKYSLIEPEERIYGKKWEKMPVPERKLHPAIEAGIKEIKAGVEEKLKKFRAFRKTVEKPVEKE